MKKGALSPILKAYRTASTLVWWRGRWRKISSGLFFGGGDDNTSSDGRNSRCIEEPVRSNFNRHSRNFSQFFKATMAYSQLPFSCLESVQFVELLPFSRSECADFDFSLYPIKTCRRTFCFRKAKVVISSLPQSRLTIICDMGKFEWRHARTYFQNSISAKGGGFCRRWEHQKPKMIYAFVAAAAVFR